MAPSWHPVNKGKVILGANWEP